MLIPAAAEAAELPPIRTDGSNRVAECATPGRLTLYLKQRNPKLNPRYEGLAGEYMRHGEALHVRWDYAFFQMLLETGSLTYGGDVKADQNNFAGLGATGKGASGERFKDISTGARAHIEHLVMYSGERVENPVAERTRNVQEWGVLTKWQRSLGDSITFSQLAKKWAPGSRRYAADIEAIATRFFEGVCREPDPQPELMAALGDTPARTRKADAAARVDAALKASEQTAGARVDPLPTVESTAAASKAKPAGAASAAEETLPVKGAAAVAAAVATPPPTSETKEKATATASAPPAVKVINAAPTTDVPVAPAAAQSAAEVSAAAQASGKAIEVAALPGTLNSTGETKAAGKSEQKSEKKSDKKPDKKEAAAAAGKCRVWTASYGGSKAIIIKAVSDKTTNYTVLDVNEGTEKREAEAYINAYAKGGQPVGEFASQTQALEKAFELCPEG